MEEVVHPVRMSRVQREIEYHSWRLIVSVQFWNKIRTGGGPGIPPGGGGGGGPPKGYKS